MAAHDSFRDVGPTSWQLIAGGLFLLPLVVVLEGFPTTLTIKNVAGFGWLATVGGALAYVLWFRGIAALPIAQVSTLGLLSPRVAAALGWAVLDQSLGPLQLTGIATVLVAGWTTQSTTANPRPATNAASQGPHPISMTLDRERGDDLGAKPSGKRRRVIGAYEDGRLRPESTVHEAESRRRPGHVS